MANDSVPCFLFRNSGDGTFTEEGLLAGVALNEDGKTFAGMGVDFSDYDNDGRPDVFVTDLSNERYRLFRHNGDGSFRDATNASGVGGATLPFSGWSTRFFDYDNDGWKDIFVAQGHVMDTIEKTSPNLRYLQPPLLLRNESGRFVRVHAGRGRSQRDWAGRGAAFGDLDNDGDVDIVVSNVGQKAVVLRNDGGNRQQLARDPDGRHEVEPRRHRLPREGDVRHPADADFTISTAVGYLSASDRRLIVGLGADTAATLVEIRWPSGIVQTFEHVEGRPDARRDRAGADDHATTRHAGAACLVHGATRRSARASRRAASSRSRAASRRAGRFDARFTDVAAQAGLTQPAIYGGVDTKRYILEVVGCGVAFLDYDNDGWLDIFVLSGTRLEGAPAGRDQSAVQEQSRRHVHRRDREGGPDAHRLGVGGHRRRLRQRRLRRSVHHLLRPERALSQQRQRHVHRRHGEGRPARRTPCAMAPAARWSTTIATAISICSSRPT